MKVYVVEEILGLETEVLGVFSSLRKAEEFAGIQNINERITEYIIDEGI